MIPLRVMDSPLCRVRTHETARAWAFAVRRSHLPAASADGVQVKDLPGALAAATRSRTSLSRVSGSLAPAQTTPTTGTAEPLIRNPNYYGVPTEREFTHSYSSTSAGYTFQAADNKFLQAASGHVEIAVLIEVADVSGMQPSWSTTSARWPPTSPVLHVQAKDHDLADLAGFTPSAMMRT